MKIHQVASVFDVKIRTYSLQNILSHSISSKALLSVAKKEKEKEKINTVTNTPLQPYAGIINICKFSSLALNGQKSKVSVSIIFNVMQMIGCQSWTLEKQLFRSVQVRIRACSIT